NHQSHVVQFYGTDDFLIKSLARFVGTALGAGDAALVIATKSHRDALIENLKANGLDTARGIKQGRFVILDAAETLSKITADGMPDAGLFNDVVGGTIGRLIAAMQREDVQIAAFGEMVSLLWADGNCDAAVRLEQLWNDLAKTYSFSLHCAYPISGFNREEHAEAFAKICAEH